jgi:hypothetical protein
MLTIRDDRVREPAREVMKLTVTPHMTTAIVDAPEREIERARTSTPLCERIAALRNHARANASLSSANFSDEERDGLWERDTLRAR